MISKYPGTCFICSKPTLANKDHYDLDTKESYHQACRDNPRPGPEAFALAAELGFVLTADVESVSWVAVGEAWSRRQKRTGTGTQTLLALRDE